MTIIGVVGVGKARGVSTLACGLAAAAAEASGSSLLIESDDGGGDIGLWRNVDVSRHSLIEATASFAVAETAEEHLAAITDYCSASEGSPTANLLALRAAGELTTQVRAFWDELGDYVSMLDNPVVVDLGRWDKGLTREIWRRFVTVGVVVANGDLAGLKRLHHGAKAMPVLNRFPTIPVVNGSPWEADEVRAKVPVAGDVLTWQPKAAALIRHGMWKKARRSVLGREINGIWSQVSEGATV